MGIYLVRFGHLWQDTAGTTPATEVGQTVKRIDDLSGNGNHATNATGWTLGENAYGRLALTAPGTAAFSALVAPTAYPLTMMVAAKTTDAAAGYCSLWQSNTQYKALVKMATAREVRAINRGGSGTFNTVGTIETVADAQILTGVFRDTTTSLRDDGLRLTTPAANSNVFGTPSTFYIFKTRALDGTMTGEFSAAAVWDKELSTTEGYAANALFRDAIGYNGALVAVGDSFTLNITDGLGITEFHPYLTAAAIGAVAINAAQSGATTAYMVARAVEAANAGPIRIAVIYGGTNDSSGDSTVQASPTPTSTAFALAAGKGARYAAGGIIDVGGEQAVVQSIATDTLTLTAPLAGGAPAAGTAVTIKTVENLVKIAQTLGAPRTLIVGQHFLNFASGTGDTLAAYQPSAQALRAKQQAAAAAAGAVYVDTAAWGRALVVAGTIAEGDDLATQAAIGDSHLIAYGEDVLLAQPIEAAITAAGWA